MFGLTMLQVEKFENQDETKKLKTKKDFTL